MKLRKELYFFKIGVFVLLFHGSLLSVGHTNNLEKEIPENNVNQVIIGLDNWQYIKNKAKGKTIYFNAWGGSAEANSYLEWAAKELYKRYRITLKHVKVADIAETITRLIGEKNAGKNKGSVDLLWINGENFRNLRNANILLSFAKSLPNWKYVDTNLPVEKDFAEPTEGLEAPWGVGQLVFLYDSRRTPDPPKNFMELLNYAQKNPGKVSYPQPPDFHGSSFLKAALLELTNSEKSVDFSKPVDLQQFKKVTTPLWDWLDKLHRVAWRKGKQFPISSAETIQLLDDGELDLAIAFNPNAAESGKLRGVVGEAVRAYAFEKGALSNIHFLAIPKNAAEIEAALVTINFLLSPEAQRVKADVRHWGDPSVLKQNILKSTRNHKKEGQVVQGYTLFPAVAEPHPSWQEALEEFWLKRQNSKTK